MKIRRYLGSNMQEAILKVKMDLGNDALILNTRKVRKKGLLKLFSKPMVEVLAAIDDIPPSRREKEQEPGEGKAGNNRPQNHSGDSRSDKEGEIAKLESKVNNMQTMLQRVYEQLLEKNGKGLKLRSDNANAYPKIFELLSSNLIRNEVDAEVAERIISTACEKAGRIESVNEAASVVCNIISGILGKPETLRLRDDGKPTVVIFLGPTGVGKTTTLAKIAANYALNQKKRIGLITADTYRIAAVEQLKTYAEILGLPITVIYSPNEIRDAINGYQDMDLILIDTAGRSYRNKPQFEELKMLVNAACADEVFLVLSAATSMLNCREILKHYSFLRQYKLIFTKIDEAPAFGIILNTKLLTGRSLSYLTTGQSVPDDIEMVNADKLAKNLLGSIN